MNGAWFEAAGIDAVSATQYASMFAEHRVDRCVLRDLNHELLKEIGVGPIGDRLRILHRAKAEEHSPLFDQITSAVSYIRDTLKEEKPEPRIGVVLGSGLGSAFVDLVRRPSAIPYKDIPYFPATTAKSHAGQLIFGEVEGKQVVVMQGRLHLYEGYSARDITFPIRVLKALGVRILLLSNACGGINPSYKAGDIVFLTNHINLTYTSPLIGANDERLGVRWPHMKDPYDPQLLSLAIDVITKINEEGEDEKNGTEEREQKQYEKTKMKEEREEEQEKEKKEKKVVVRKGVYAAMVGPAGATRAELRYLSMIGADVYGMSTVPEVIAALHGREEKDETAEEEEGEQGESRPYGRRMRVFGLGVITDMCVWNVSEDPTIEECLRVARASAPFVAAIFEGMIQRL
ncbi:Purine nucleoside phosphorylase [Balamuthia mandrillaris]